MKPALDLVSWPARTERLTLRPAVADDDVSTWRFRQLEPVCRWLTHASPTFEDYQARFRDPARLARRSSSSSRAR